MDNEDVVHMCTHTHTHTHAHTRMQVMEYYSATNKNEIMPFVATWMDLQIIVLSEVSQKQKDKYHILTHIYGIQKDSTNDPTCRAAKETQT